MKRKRKNDKNRSLMTSKTVIVIESCILAILIITITIVIVSSYLHKKDDSNNYAVELGENSFGYIDAEDYFSDNAVIISVENAKKSKHLYSENEVKNNLLKRGFTNSEISYDYSIKGELLEVTSTEADSSDELHPSYNTFYTNNNGDYWVIYIVNNTFMANPLSYNLNNESGVEVIVSESNYVTSYDCVSNSFYETSPNESALSVIKVDSIDSKTLDKLTIDEINSILN